MMTIHGNSTVTARHNMSIITIKQQYHNSNDNLKKETNELNIINTQRTCSSNAKSQKHIKFQDKVKYFYFDWDLPVLSPQRSDLNLQSVNEQAIKNYPNICVLEEMFLRNFEKARNLVKLEGYVIVRNFTFEKKLTVRYSLIDWKTFTDTDAFYINSKNSEWDRFAFFIRIDASLLAKIDNVITLSFAIKYSYGDAVHWDNNGGDNYKFKLQYLQ